MNAKDILGDVLLHFYYSKLAEYYMSTLKMKIGTVEIHALCWLLYISYEVLVSGILTGGFSHFYYYLFFYLLNISLFYVHGSLAMPFSFKKPPYTLWKLPVLLLLELVLYIAATIFISHFLERLQLRSSPLVINKRFITGTIWRGALFILFSSGYYFLVYYLSKQKQELQDKLEMEKLKVKLFSIEIDFLRSQINPHLLFNSLNFIKYASKHAPDEADEAITKLSEIMDFALARSADGFVPLIAEQRQVENIIRLNQLRFSQKLQLCYRATVVNEGAMILPVVLITLTENIFKHGDLHHVSQPASISLECCADRIEFRTSNYPISGNFPVKTRKLGLSNTIFRLEKTYGDRFVFDYGMKGDTYQTYLCIHL